MSKLSMIQNKLDRKLFTTNVLGSTVTLYSYVEPSATSYGGYEDVDPTYGTGVEHIAVPYNSIVDKYNVQPFGDFQTGDIIIVFKHNVTIKQRDKVTFRGDTYKVIEVKENPLNDGNAASIVQLRLKH